MRTPTRERKSTPTPALPQSPRQTSRPAALSPQPAQIPREPYPRRRDHEQVHDSQPLYDHGDWEQNDPRRSAARRGHRSSPSRGPASVHNPKTRLKPFITNLIENSKGYRHSTLANMEHCGKLLCHYFGPNAYIEDITEDHARSYEAMLEKSNRADATIENLMLRAKLFFDAAVAQGLIDENPFNFCPRYLTDLEARFELKLRLLKNDRIPAWRRWPREW